ncbi:MFS transporter [Pedobacter nutrimenti]|uniref:MFS transporter n=1 Tax=Pedobacter nutrimenti TaxID=1241337 RepID=UPI00292EAFE1|nr:MFS transporter [Pedobacter nutrimenti]
MNSTQQNNSYFTGYQKFVLFIIAITQFTVVLDFTVISPLGDFMMKSLLINTAQFGTAVSAYAFSAGISGLLTAGFADRFDRKKLLLFFYIGFALGTFFCAIAPNYQTLVIARIITGLFGGVISSITMAIVTDLFSIERRGKVMSYVQMSFSSSQVLGIPLGLYIANKFSWQLPFLWISIMAGVIIILLIFKLKPVTNHLKIQTNTSVFSHLWHTISQSKYQLGFLNTALLSIGGFMLMPFGSVFAINNLKISGSQLPLMFMITGIFSLITMPLIGKLADKVSKFKLFAGASISAIIIINIYTHYTVSPFWLVVVTNLLMMAAITMRMIPSQTLTTAIPHPQDRGAFMSINSSLQQIAGGLTAMLAGFVIVRKDNYSPLVHYDYLGYLASFTMLITIYLVYKISFIINEK